MRYGKIAGIDVSQLCFGTLTMSPMQKNLPPKEGAGLILYAAESGVNFLDTADLYDNYEHIAFALREKPDLVIATKSYAYDEATAEKGLGRALKELGRDYVDFYLLHEQESEHTLRGHEKALEYLWKQKQAGKVRAVGVSTHYVRCVRAAADNPYIEVIHPLINMDGIGIVDGGADDMKDAIAYAAGKGVGIYAMKALGGGHLLRDPKTAIDYVRGLDGIQSLAIGMQSRDEIDCNVALVNGEEPPAGSIERAAAQKRELLIDYWCRGCGACEARCPAGAITVTDGKARVSPDKCLFCGYCAKVCPEFCIKVI